MAPIGPRYLPAASLRLALLHQHVRLRLRERLQRDAGQRAADIATAKASFSSFSSERSFND